MFTTKLPPEPPTEVLIPSLPNDVALNILARVPRQYHPVLSAVSKPFRSAVSSPHLFAVRSILNCSESLLYLNVRFLCHTHHHWFAVHRKHNNLLQLAPLPPIPVKPQVYGSAYAAIGPKVYVIGGYLGSGTSDRDSMPEPCSDVWVLDCRFHTWERGPSMRTPRFNAQAAAMDGKVYVVGGVPGKSWIEVLDPAVGRWEAIPCPLDGIETSIFYFKLVDGKIISIRLRGEEFRLDPTSETWEVLPIVAEALTREWCVVDGVSYRWYRGGSLEVFHEKIGRWKEVKGATEGKPKNLCDHTLLNLDGRLAVTFAETTDLKKGKVGVWCAEIDVTDDADGNWWGRIHWSDKVLLLPEISWGIPEENFYESPFSCLCKRMLVSL